MEYSDSVQFLTIIIIIENVQPGSIMVEYLHIIGVMGDTKEKVKYTINIYFEKQMILQFCYRFVIFTILL